MSKITLLVIVALVYFINAVPVPVGDQTNHQWKLGDLYNTDAMTSKSGNGGSFLRTAVESHVYPGKDANGNPIHRTYKKVVVYKDGKVFEKTTTD